jgi:hypothetical protein
MKRSEVDGGVSLITITPQESSLARAGKETPRKITSVGARGLGWAALPGLDPNEACPPHQRNED